MRKLRALAFGFVWAYFIRAMGVQMFSFWMFLSLIPAWFVFFTIEHFVFEEKKVED